MNRQEPPSADADSGAPGSQARILLLMDPTGDRSLLEEWLGSAYDVRVATEATALEEPFDLCLVDEPKFARHREALAERKRRAEPTFLPYLLMLSDRDVSPEDARLREYVDDLVRTPTRKAELRSRLVGLLSRRDLSKALAEQQERYRRILRTIPDPVFVLDERGVVAECNPAFDEDLRHAEELIVGSALEEIPAFNEDTEATLSALTERTREPTSADENRNEPGTDTATVTYRRTDGTSRTAEVAVAPIRIVSDSTDGTLFVLRDVTERQNREQALKRERERLRDFASMLAHEVRNPLNVAQGYLEDVTPETEAEREAVERVIEAQARMERMIKELLAHARGGTVESVQPVELRAMAETAWDATRTAEAALELDLGEETVEADPENLQTVLENLFRNAMDHAGPEVTVRVGLLEEGGFYVEDDGPGIPPEDRESVFESGFTTSPAGSGLGLALVRQMADAHGWDVRMGESEAGGARIEFSVPA